MIKITYGMRKYSAFLISLSVYSALFLFAVIAGFVKDDSVPNLAFQLGVGISTVVGSYYAGNVLAKKKAENE